MVVFVQSCYDQGKEAVFFQSGCNRAKRLYSVKIYVFGQKWLYSVKSGCNWTKMDVFVQGGGIRAKVVVLGQKWLYLGKVAV